MLTNKREARDARIKSLHDEAMFQSNKADVLRRSGQAARAADCALKAFVCEEDAAKLCPASAEPTRSVLFRSAAWLALQAGQPARALEMAAIGLQGHSVPAEIKAELLDVARDALERA